MIATQFRFILYALIGCITIQVPVEAFSCQTRRIHQKGQSSRRGCVSVLLWSSKNSNEDDGESETLNLDSWRKFRASLIASEQQSNATPDETDEPLSPTENENALLLQRQNESLAKEYKSGVWAHTVPELEVGGLLCRLPIEAQLYVYGEGHWKEKLSTILEVEPLPSSKSSNFDQVEHWMELSERMIARELESMTAEAKNGILNPNDLKEESKDLLVNYVGYKQSWQEVCLVLSKTSAVVINRPIATNVNRGLAQLLLEGTPESKAKVVYDFQFVDRFVEAFGEKGIVYKGGPEEPLEPALMIHGISDLEGATEVSFGTGIYEGGVEAAVDGILSGKYKPLEFRFFLGRHTNLKLMLQDGAYQPIACARSLALKQCLSLPKPLWHEGKSIFYSLVLDSVVCRPHSSFHGSITKVLELCGGDFKDISLVEIAKRGDLS